ncbi:MAG: cytochrome c, partial [Rhizobacter sp.]
MSARRWVRGGSVALMLAALLIGGVVWLNQRGEDALTTDTAATAPGSPDQIARGAYLARAGNCLGCHTERGGAA